jgi:hypothetical protein
MSFNIKNTSLSASSISNVANEPLYNALKLNNLLIGDLSNISQDSTLIWDSINKEWTYTNSVVGPTGVISGDLIPSADNLYSLGATGARWKDLYVSGSTIYLGDSSISTGTGPTGSKSITFAEPIVTNEIIVGTSQGQLVQQE